MNHLQFVQPLMHYTLNPYGHLRRKVSGGKFHSGLFTAGGKKGDKKEQRRGKAANTVERKRPPLDNTENPDKGEPNQ